MHGGCCSFGPVLYPLVSVIEVLDGPAVTHYDAIEAPFLLKDVKHETLVRACWLAVHAVVCKHHLIDIAFLHKILECRKICFPKVLFRSHGVK